MTSRLPSPLRAAVLAFVGALLVSGAIVVWIQGADREREQERVEAMTGYQARSLRAVVERSLTVAYALGALVRQGDGEIADFEAVAGEMLDYFPSISVLALSPGGFIRQTAPFEANQASLGFDQFADPVQGEEARRARDSGQLTVAGPLELVQGGLGVVGRLPVYLQGDDGTGTPATAEPPGSPLPPVPPESPVPSVPPEGEFWGLVNVVLPVDRIVDESGLRGLLDWDLAFELWRFDPNTGERQVIAGEGSVPLEQAVSREVSLPNGTWVLSAVPSGGWGATSVLLLRGSGAFLIALLTGWVAHLLTSLGNHRHRLQDEVEERTAEIRHARTQLEATLAAIPDLLFEVERDGRFVGAHARRPDLLLAPREALPGTRILDWMPPETVAIILEALREAELNGSSVGRQYSLDIPSSGRRWFELSVARKPADGRGASTYMVLARDVTARRRADEALRESEARYLQAQKMESVGRLAGGVAHDFNNLLTVIRGAADMAAQELPDQHTAQEDLAQIRASAERGAALTQQLLDTSSQQVIRPERLELNQLVQEFLELIRRMIGTDIQVYAALSSTPLWIRSDRNQLSQIFLNLAANARDAMPSGGLLILRTSVEGEVVRMDEAAVGRNAAVSGGAGPEGMRHPSPDPAQSWVRLSFEDSGHGMPPEVRERVFEPFFTTKARGRGSGLGLATVYGIVRQMGGDVTVESEPGQGSHFHLWIPSASASTSTPTSNSNSNSTSASTSTSGSTSTFTSAPASAATRSVEVLRPADGSSSVAPTSAESGGEPGTPKAPPVRILLVDDEPAILRLARRLLERAGYEVRTASRGDEALDLLAGDDAFIPDALVTDVVMPGMNGVELALQIRQTRFIPVLFISGFADHPVLREEGLPALSTFVPKPYEADLLLEELARLLQQGAGAPPGAPERPG
ncbi:MAG: response regulator [Gemmatimonadales bacterium]|nr:MAG: response regulator [Gemmatimonadales bacterium]